MNVLIVMKDINLTIMENVKSKKNFLENCKIFKLSSINWLN